MSSEERMKLATQRTEEAAAVEQAAWRKLQKAQRKYLKFKGTMYEPAFKEVYQRLTLEHKSAVNNKSMATKHEMDLWASMNSVRGGGDHDPTLT